MRITREWLHRHATKGRAWNRKQLQVLGVPWPPTKGWLSRAVGRELSESDRAAFESTASGTRENTAGGTQHGDSIEQETTMAENINTTVVWIGAKGDEPLNVAFAAEIERKREDDYLLHSWQLVGQTIMAVFQLSYRVKVD